MIWTGEFLICNLLRTDKHWGIAAGSPFSFGFFWRLWPFVLGQQLKAN
jgi:hypothetical protein